MDAKSPHRLRVIQIGMHERGAGGGVERIFWDLYDHLSQSPDLDLSAFFFCHRSDQKSARTGEYGLGSTKQPGYQRLWNVRRAVFNELKDWNEPNSLVIVSHFALYASALLPNLSWANHVVHFHGPWTKEAAAEGRGWVNTAAKRAVERAVYSSAKAFITLSQAFKDLLTAEYRIDPSRVHVIPGGIDCRRFSPGDRTAARKQLGWPLNATIVFCVRRLVRRMGLESLLDAFASVAGEHPMSVLMIGGTGPLRDELETRARRLGAQIRFTGFIPETDLALAYRAADLSIVPSQSLEGFGLTSLESLACGTPVLVTPVGGLPEAVAGLSPELVLADRMAETLGRSLDRFLKGGLVVPSAADCRHYVEANFSWQRISEHVKKVYRQAAR
jgi:glycosyltransferase involved in cell wall biosynthesis